MSDNIYKSPQSQVIEESQISERKWFHHLKKFSLSYLATYLVFAAFSVLQFSILSEYMEDDVPGFLIFGGLFVPLLIAIPGGFIGLIIPSQKKIIYLPVSIVGNFIVLMLFGVIASLFVPIP